MQVVFVRFPDVINVKSPECYVMPRPFILRNTSITPDLLHFIIVFTISPRLAHDPLQILLL